MPVDLAPELLEILRRPDSNTVVNMLDVDLADRPTFFDGLLTRLSELRAQTGRPHWIVVDEAHHLVPASRHAVGTTLPHDLHATILVTVHPDQLAPEVLATVETVAAVGDAPASTIRHFCTALGVPPPPLPGALLWEGAAEHWTAVWSGRREQIEAAAALLGARIVRESPLSLDEIFVARSGAGGPR